MKEKFIDLVICNCGNEAHLFVAPAFSNFKKGDIVVTQPYNCHGVSHGENRAVVIESTTILPSNPEYGFILSLASAGGLLPLRRILRRVEYYDLDYSNYDETEE